LLLLVGWQLPLLESKRHALEVPASIQHPMLSDGGNASA
jgi:hypothetical protein